ncbi:MAG: Fe-S cluster assembly ATPase SufC, partial [Bacteroidales bacterium]|nr:Fe-S cluster assembly ATPase SufC [Bacteroidales bacterium]
LDETDSGLDVDALKIVAEGVNSLHTPENASIIITHYEKLLEYVTPDIVHVLKDGKIVATGGPEVIDIIQSKGFESF